MGSTKKPVEIIYNRSAHKGKSDSMYLAMCEGRIASMEGALKHSMQETKDACAERNALKDRVKYLESAADDPWGTRGKGDPNGLGNFMDRAVARINAFRRVLMKIAEFDADPRSDETLVKGAEARVKEFETASDIRPYAEAQRILALKSPWGWSSLDQSVATITHLKLCLDAAHEGEQRERKVGGETQALLDAANRSLHLAETTATALDTLVKALEMAHGHGPMDEGPVTCSEASVQEDEAQPPESTLEEASIKKPVDDVNSEMTGRDVFGKRRFQTYPQWGRILSECGHGILMNIVCSKCEVMESIVTRATGES